MFVHPNTLRVAATRQGKSKSAARDAIDWDGALIVLDPHKDSLARDILIHCRGDILYECLSDPRHGLGWDFLSPSHDRDPLVRRMVHDRRARAFADILLRRRGGDGIATTPLREEWTLAAIQLYLDQHERRSLTVLPSAFQPGTDEFEALIDGCANRDVAEKFAQLRNVTPRTLRAEVGSAVRLITAVCHSPAFAMRCRDGFDFEGFIDSGGKLVVERGDEISEDAMRTMMGAIQLKTIEYAKTRKRPFPPIRLIVDEANNAGLIGIHESRALAETQKFGLTLDILVQTLDFPGDILTNVMQNCLRKEWFGCASVDIARKAAQDLIGSTEADESNAARMSSMIRELMTLKPGWRWVHDRSGVRKEYVPLLENPWIWPTLQVMKLREKIAQIHAKPEYGANATSNSSPLSKKTQARPGSSRSSSPAERWKRATRKQHEE